jgi:hypothetical protein
MLALAALVAILPALTLAKPVDLAQRNLSKRYTGVLIKANRDGLCISVDGGNQKANYADGTAVVSIPCSQATTWDINPGSGSVLVSGHNGFALDAGTNPSNNGALKVSEIGPDTITDADADVDVDAAEPRHSATGPQTSETEKLHNTVQDPHESRSHPADLDLLPRSHAADVVLHRRRPHRHHRRHPVPRRGTERDPDVPVHHGKHEPE